ncbi:MAG TPA: hypothetical protein VLM85_08050 [Polyangiaceae bacterium]|nr:hypothetical protein [Polyangiaceae bacterium]
MDLDKKKAVYTIIDKDSAQGNGKRSFWVRIGAAFVNGDGSYSVKLDALPVNGTLHVRDWPTDSTRPAPAPLARTLEADIRAATAATRPQNADVFAGV